MMHPDEINDILATPARDIGVSEAVEIEAREMGAQMMESMGREKFVAFIVTGALPYEAKIRGRVAADHPIIAMFDEYHAAHA